MVASEYGNHKWVPYVSYVYAALVSTSRVIAQEHFTSDVVVGGAIGFFIGRYVVRTERIHREHLPFAKSRLFSPAVSPLFSPVAKTVTLVGTTNTAVRFASSESLSLWGRLSLRRSLANSPTEFFVLFLKMF